jgi:hypothetical protein
MKKTPLREKHPRPRRSLVGRVPLPSKEMLQEMLERNRMRVGLSAEVMKELVRLDRRVDDLTWRIIAIEGSPFLRLHANGRRKKKKQQAR